ncbi:ribonuclease HII [Oscillibacter sp.]|uniref:ribonuclease HII n=1 Tax=Oscillibacter sp. TaxID=1945593 RepID=UPI00338EAB72
MEMDLWTYEREQWNSGFTALCGVDEAGAGLAGRCTPLPSFCPEIGFPGLNDSKKLTAKKRDVLFDQITATAEAYSIAFVTAEEIDSLDILNARMLAMNRAIEGLSIRPDLCLIDGNRDHGSSVSITAPHMCLVGGDGKSASIAAASILAKVSRDRYVTGVLDREYPQYQFAKHKGYGTKLHYEMLDRYGPCPAHRRTFLKKWEARRT